MRSVPGKRRLHAACALALCAACFSSAAWATHFSGQNVAAPAVVTSALTLYVDATNGNDANDCKTSGTGACLTVQAAIDKIPQVVKAPVVVNLAAGTYSTARISGFSVDSQAGGRIQLKGTMSTATGLTSNMTGTATGITNGSGNTYGTLTDSTAAWTVDQLRGYFIEITSGTGTGDIRPIVSNTATAITVAGTWSSFENSAGAGNPVAGSGYTIRTPGTVLNGWARTYTSDFLISAGTPYTLFIGNNGGGFDTTAPAVVVERIKLIDPVTSPGTTFYMGFCAGTGANFMARLVRFDSMLRAYYVYVAGDGAILHIKDSSAAASGAGSGKVLFQVAASAPGLVYIANSEVDNMGTFYFGPVGALMVQACYFKTLAAGIPVDAASRVYITATQMDTVTGPCVLASGASFWGSGTGGGLASGSFKVDTSTLNNCAGGAIKAVGPVLGMVTGAVTGTGNGAFGISAAEGARIKSNSSVSVTGTVDISIDGTTNSYATLRAGTPKLLKDANYLSTIYEP